MCQNGLLSLAAPSSCLLFAPPHLILVHVLPYVLELSLLDHKVRAIHQVLHALHVDCHPIILAVETEEISYALEGVVVLALAVLPELMLNQICAVALKWRRHGWF